MGSGASSGAREAFDESTPKEIEAFLEGLPKDVLQKVKNAVAPADGPTLSSAAAERAASDSSTVHVQVTVIPTNAAAPRKVAVILPGKKYANIICADSQFAYHLLDEPTYSMLDPFGFDADAYVETAIEYCRNNKIDGVFGFDCFPSLLASIVNQTLNLKGPSFQSVFLCANKFYMREHLSPDIPVMQFDPHVPAVEPPKDFPIVVKQSDSQFYTGTWILQSLADWEALLKDLQSRFSQEVLDRRKRFYFKWHEKFGLKFVNNLEDVALFHIEPHFEGREHQIEVVVEENELLVADTGDLIKTGDLLVMFVTPGSFDIPRDWAHEVAGKLRDQGYKNQAMDIEFVFTKSGPQLIEINSRYSYMGWASFFEDRSTSEESVLRKKPDLRNLENRTMSCLGDPPTRLPSDEDSISKLAIMMYTQQAGLIEEIMDLKFLEEYVKAGSAEAWAPKHPFLAGRVTAADLCYPGGWCKLGCLLMTAQRKDFEATNAKIADCQKKLFQNNSYVLAQDDEVGYEVDKDAIRD